MQGNRLSLEHLKGDWFSRVHGHRDRFATPLVIYRDLLGVLGLQLQQEIVNDLLSFLLFLAWKQLMEKFHTCVDPALLQFDFLVELHDLLHQFHDS